MMKLKKKLLSSAMAVALATGVGFSGSASAIHLAEDGIGQALMAPVYLANGDYSTKVAIVNTRTDVAVKAKVVLRSYLTSAEVLDFICYLSPGDVCRFEIRNVNGQATLWSDDDSIKSSPNTFASVSPVNQALFDQNLGNGDNNELGHMEVIGAYAVKGDIVTPSGTVKVYRGMPKPALARIFDTPRATLAGLGTNQNESASFGVGRVVNGVCSVAPAANGGAPCDANGNAPSTLIRSTDPTWVRLSGFMELSNASDRMGYRIPALAGEIWDNTPATAPADQLQGFDGRVISNPAYDAQGGEGAAETAVGFGWGGVSPGFGAVPNYDNIIEVEHALAVTNLKGSYEDDSNSTPAGVNRTRMVVTFPTKYRHITDICKTGFVRDVPRNVLYSPPFQTNGNVIFSLGSYDNQEHNISISGGVFSGGPVAPVNNLPAEVNYFLPSWPATAAGGNNFESGWFDMGLTPRAGCSYPGLPALGFMHKYHQSGNSFSNSWLVPAAHEPELVNRNMQ